MESASEELTENTQTTQTKSKKKKKKKYVRKTKKIQGHGWCRKKGGNGKKSESTVTTDTECGDASTSETTSEKARPGRVATKILTTRASQLMTKKQKKQIESYYYLDMSMVDKKKVEKSIFNDHRKYRCELCQQTYARLDKCQVHVWRHYNMLPYVCRACDFKTLTVTSIRIHVRKFHLRLLLFKCDQCDKKYMTASLLKDHMVRHTNAKRYHCDNCGFACLTKPMLISHMTKHKPEKDILCDICNKGFFSAKTMRAHRNTHEESNAIKCDICQAPLSSERALERHHIKIHSEQYTCHFCDKKFVTRRAVHNHIQHVHSEGKHQCPICPNVYKSNAMLQDHILKHQGIRKYKCHICDKAFTQRTHISTHMAVHDKKRFACPGCKKAFNRMDNMKTHTKSCIIFITNPGLTELLSTKKYKVLDNLDDNASTSETLEPLDLMVDMDPILNPDANIKFDSLDEALASMDIISIDNIFEAANQIITESTNLQ